jgi:hypothetical protein
VADLKRQHEVGEREDHGRREEGQHDRAVQPLVVVAGREEETTR